MKIKIELDGDDREQLVQALIVAGEHLALGQCHLNLKMCPGGDVLMAPADAESERQFRKAR